MDKTKKAHIALSTVAIIWGISYSVIKDVLDANVVQPAGFILMRVIAAAALFSLVSRFFDSEKIEKKDYFKIALCGLFGVAINQLFFFEGLKLSTPINAALIMTTTPMLVLVISAAIIREKITGNKLLGIILGAGGAIYLILYDKTVSFLNQQWLGNLLLFVNAFSYGIYLVLVKSLMKKYNPITIIRWVFIIGLFFVLPFGVTDLIAADWQSFSPKVIGSIAFVIIFPTFLAYILNVFALKSVNPSIVSVYIYVQPFLATFFALLLVKDELSVEKIIAGSVILLGVFFTSKK